jgi:hypothetical protein
MTSLPVLIPDGHTPCVNVGDTITAGQVIAVNNTHREKRINIPRELSVNLKNAKNYIKKIPGERVEKGEVIAVKKSFFGNGIVLRSKVEGTVGRYERDSGDLIIITSSPDNSQKLDLVSPVEGIVELCDNREIVIKTDKNVLNAEFATGEAVTAELLAIGTPDAYHIDSKTIGKITVCASLTREMILKGVGIGTAGFIGVDIKDSDLEYLIEKKIATPVVRIDAKSFERVYEENGKKVAVNPEAKALIFIKI